MAVGNGEEAALGRPAAVPGPAEPRDGAAELRAARDGDRAAAEAVAARHWDDAYRAAYLILHDASTAEDVTQEALVAAIRALPRFDPARRFEPWLHRIVTNRALDHLRAVRRRAEVALSDAEPAGGGAEGLPDHLAAALLGLDPEDRAIVVLRHLFDYRAREIAPMVGLRPSGVRTRLQRALAKLRAELGEGR
jgi:RNA polymerase sigma-70 factor (ECF subfamily)